MCIRDRYVDGSNNSQWALQVALVLIRHFDTELTLLIPDAGVDVDPAWLTSARTQLAAATAGALREVSQPGSAEEAILAESAAHAYDLILLAPAGRRGLRRLLHGSRVAQVVRQSNTSVLVARAPLTEIRRVLVSVGGDVYKRQVCSHAHHWLLRLSPSTWWAAVAVPHRKPAGKERAATLVISVYLACRGVVGR